MQIITAGNFAKPKLWAFEDLLTTHDICAPVDGVLPDLTEPFDGDEYPAIRRLLMNWKADLGARDRMTWDAFLASYRKILQPALEMRRLGALDDRQIKKVVSIVNELENFKDTVGRKLVFGSKAADFHFPAVVPIMSSDVERGLKFLQRAHPEVLRKHLGANSGFRFGSAVDNLQSYEKYVRLGNALMRDIDAWSVTGLTERRSYGVDAKVFELCIVAFDPQLNG